MDIPESFNSKTPESPVLPLNRDLQRFMARNAANACLKIMLLNQTKRPLRTILSRLKRIDKQIARVIDHG